MLISLTRQDVCVQNLSQSQVKKSSKSLTTRISLMSLINFGGIIGAY